MGEPLTLTIQPVVRLEPQLLLPPIKLIALEEVEQVLRYKPLSIAALLS
jgi:hypothetical protein